MHTLKKLIRKGLDINSQNSEGYTPLMVAVKRGTIDQVKFLLEHGANINIKNKNNENVFNFVDFSKKSNIRKKELLALLDQYRTN